METPVDVSEKVFQSSVGISTVGDVSVEIFVFVLAVRLVTWFEFAGMIAVSIKNDTIAKAMMAMTRGVV